MTVKSIIVQEDFPGLETCRSDTRSGLRWDLVFTLPVWLRVWWQNFGSNAELYLRSVRQDGKIIGIAPLQLRNKEASIIGSPDVCDYQDFVTSPGAEKEFFNAVLDDLRSKGIESLYIEPMRADSSAANFLMPIARERDYAVSLDKVDVSLDMDLPNDWEEYLSTLDGKQRHELRRKMRNLQKVDEPNYLMIGDESAIPGAIDAFLQLFPEARRDKAEFMTQRMQTFFRTLAQSLSEVGVVRFGILEFTGKTVAMVMYFDYNESVYLYNSAYMPDYRSLSVGVISKARCIEDNIRRGKKKFDFLKGAEHYKYHLGGKEIPLYSMRITFP